MRTSFHHQPEAQHPNFQLSTRWQADYLPYLLAVRAGTAPDPIQNNSGLTQGPAPWFSGRLMVRRSKRAICYPRRSSMKQPAVEERWGWSADIMEVGLYSVLILVVALLWVYIPA
jgi:hypothetical protein